MKKLRIAVIFGGRSAEHEVSLVSAASIIKTLDRKKYSVKEIGIAKDGQWLTGSGANEKFKKRSLLGLKKVKLAPGAKPEFDVAFPIVHGTYGEDGKLQGLFEMLDVPYVGCGVLSSAACMDKYTTKMIFKAHGLPQVKFMHTARAEINNNFPELKRKIIKNIGLPCFIKPSNLGSSIGIAKIKNAIALKSALKNATRYDESVLIEKAVSAREIECAVLGNENPVASVAGEIVPNREFYDYYSKYVDNKCRFFIPARIPAAQMRKIQTLAVQAFKIMQCSGMARVDFFMDKKTNALYINELNTLPGFTSISMYPKMFMSSGIPYPRLLDRLIALALERWREKKRTAVDFESKSEWYK